MSWDMTRVREGDLALGGGLFMERNKIDVPSLYIGWSLRAYPSNDRHRYVKEHLLRVKYKQYILSAAVIRENSQHTFAQIS